MDLQPQVSSFSDVDPSGTHAGAIGAIHAAGITLGCNESGTDFCPHDAITRAGVASFLARALDLEPRSTGPFTDVSGVHVGNINALAHAGITIGCNDAGTQFCPRHDVSRAQMASLLARGFELDPVQLLPRMRLTGLQTECAGSTPVCSTTSGPANTGDFYIQEGWFYNLPYESGDAGRFASAEFRLLIDGERVDDDYSTPMTDLLGTMVVLEGYLVTDLEPGLHTIVAEWWWDGEAALTSVVDINVTG